MLRLAAGAIVAAALVGGGTAATAATDGHCRAGAQGLRVCPVAGAPGAVVLDDGPGGEGSVEAVPQVASVGDAVITARAPVLPLTITVPPVARPRPSRPVVSKGVAPKTWKAPGTSPSSKTPVAPRRPARR